MKNLNNMLKNLAVSAALLLSVFGAAAQQENNLARMLGYPADSKLLIIHADDMGLSQSVNSACIEAFEAKGITCGSIMETCPWALEINKYLREHPEIDAGIHLTLTSEWENYKWGGVLPSDQISSLLDSLGYFYPTVAQVGKSANAGEAELELKAQIDRAVSMGVTPTHIDTHMGSVLANPELVKIYLGLSDKYKLPILFPRQYLNYLPADLAKALGSKLFIIDNLFMLDGRMIKGEWIDPYRTAIESLKPGLNEIIVHLGKDNDEMKAICTGHEDYGSLWRQKDLETVTGSEFRELLKKNNVILIGWRPIRDLMNK